MDTKLTNLDVALARWDIDEANKDGPDASFFQRSPSFPLRSLIADYLDADSTLQKADDLALRMSFYRRFLPRKYSNWPEFLKIDGTNFVVSALENKHLWQSKDEREKLSRVCWAAPDPGSFMDLPDHFLAYEDKYRKTDPAWFSEPEVESHASIQQDLTEIQRSLEDIQEKVDQQGPNQLALIEIQSSLADMQRTVEQQASNQQILAEIQHSLADMQAIVDRRTLASPNAATARQRWSQVVPWWIWLGIGALLTYILRQHTP